MWRQRSNAQGCNMTLNYMVQDWVEDGARGHWGKISRKHSEDQWPEPLQGRRGDSMDESLSFEQWNPFWDFWLLDSQRTTVCCFGPPSYNWSCVKENPEPLDLTPETTRKHTTRATGVCFLLSGDKTPTFHEILEDTKNSLPTISLFMEEGKETEKAIIKKSENSATPTVLRSGCGLR